MTDFAAGQTSEPSGTVRDVFAHVDTWVFDLDDTLYPRSIGLHNQMQQRVVRFIADHMKIDRAAAEAVHHDYYERFGATLVVTGTDGSLEIKNFVAPQIGCAFNVTDKGETRAEPTDGPATSRGTPSTSVWLPIRIRDIDSTPEAIAMS